MPSQTYMGNRKKYFRPQAILFSKNAGTASLGSDGVPYYMPVGYEVGSNQQGVTDPDLRDQFIILTDHNRQSLDFKTQRIESKQRTINGRMRSYHVADKVTLSTSWNDLPSRAFSVAPNFNVNGQADTANTYGDIGFRDHTVDGGAAGGEILDWYKNNTGSFWMFLAYDNYKNFGSNDQAYAHLNQYNEVFEVFFSDFSYSVSKRGQGIHGIDLWNVSLSVEEA